MDRGCSRLELLADPGFFLDGADLLAEISLDGFEAFTAASEGEDGAVHDIFEDEGESDVESEEADRASREAGGGLCPGQGREFVEAVEGVADGGERMIAEIKGFP